MCFRPTGITTTSSPPFLPASLDNNILPLPFAGEREDLFWRYGVVCFISMSISVGLCRCYFTTYLSFQLEVVHVDFVFVCHDSATQASLMALAAPNVRK